MEVVSRWTRAAERAALIKRLSEATGPKLWWYRQLGDKVKDMLELGPNPNPDTLMRLCPAGWSEDFRSTCDECGERVDAVVHIGQEPDYESRTAWVCAKCLLKAMVLIEP